MSSPPPPRFDVVVVGGGIVGLATAHAVARTGRSVAVVEREPRLAAHQTGNNSNVIHSGLYYAPGGHKARLAVAGCAETVAFCRTHDLPCEVTGKLVVATKPDEKPRLAELKRRGDANGVESHELDEAGMRAHEPHVRGLRALFVPSTGVTDYRAIAEKIGELVQKDAARSISAGRSAASCGVAPTSSSARTAATCSAPRSWSAPACAATSWPGRRRRPGRADHPVPRRVLRVRRARRGAGQGPDLSGAGPGVPVPWRARHAGDRRQRARRPERRARARPRGLLVGRGEAQGAARVAGLSRDAAARAAALALRARRDAPVAVARGDGPPDPAVAARRPGRRPAPGRCRGAGPGGPEGRQPGRRLPVRRPRFGFRRSAACAQRAVPGRDRGVADRPGDPGALTGERLGPL